MMSLGLVSSALCADLVIVQAFLLIHGVMHGVEPFAGAVDRGAVREMPAVQQVEAHDRVAQVDQGLIDGVVGRRAGERLHIDVDLVGAEAVGCEGLGGAAAGQRLHHVGVFHALVVARVAGAAVVGQAGRVIQDLLLRSSSACLRRDSLRRTDSGRRRTAPRAPPAGRWIRRRSGSACGPGRSDSSWVRSWTSGSSSASLPRNR